MKPDQVTFFPDFAISPVIPAGSPDCDSFEDVEGDISRIGEEFRALPAVEDRATEDFLDRGDSLGGVGGRAIMLSSVRVLGPVNGSEVSSTIAKGLGNVEDA